MSLTPAGNRLNSNLMPDRLERIGMFSNCFYITSVKRGNDEISHTCLYSVLQNSVGNFSHSESHVHSKPNGDSSLTVLIFLFLNKCVSVGPVTF